MTPYMSIDRAYAYTVMNYKCSEDCMIRIAVGIQALSKALGITRYYDIDYFLYHNRDKDDKLAILDSLASKPARKPWYKPTLYLQLSKAARHSQQYFKDHKRYITDHSKHILDKYLCDQSYSDMLDVSRFTRISMPKPMSKSKAYKWLDYNYNDVDTLPISTRDSLAFDLSIICKSYGIGQYDDLNYYIYYANPMTKTNRLPASCVRKAMVKLIKYKERVKWHIFIQTKARYFIDVLVSYHTEESNDRT